MISDRDRTLTRETARGRRFRPRGAATVAVSAVAAILALVLATVVVNLVVVDQGQGWVDTPEDAPSAPIAIVLGARVYSDGSPSPVLADRLDTGIELYLAGRVDRLLLTGDGGGSDRDGSIRGAGDHNEVGAMRTYVLARGVPVEDVVLDGAGNSTLESLRRARDLFSVRDALVVTQDFHLPRTLYVARRLGLDVTGVSADRRAYTDISRLRLREWLARCKAFLQLHVLDSQG